MNKYQQVPERIIDFHDYTTRAVKKALEELIDKGDHRHVRLIVGKGLHSQNGPVLKTFVKEYLHKKNIRFSQSKVHDGGEGALEVFLKDV